MRIFVFGEEVTEDVTKCVVDWHDGRAPNISEIVLASPFDRYIITEKDIHALYDTVDIATVQLPDILTTLVDAVQASPLGDKEGRFSVEGNIGIQPGQIDTFKEEVEKSAKHIDRLIRERITRDIPDEVKRRVLNAKIRERVTIAEPDITSTTTEGAKSAQTIAALKGDALRYSVQQGDCIFHSNDHVRVFWRDPFNPRIWFHMTAGFVSDWSDSVTEDNQKTVTLRVEDVLRTFRYARMTTNPGIFDIDAIKEVEDLVVRTVFAAGFADFTLTELLYTFVFGPTLANTRDRTFSAQTPGEKPEDNYLPIRRVSVNGAFTSEIPKEGVGSFNRQRSLVVIFGPEAKGEDDKTSTESNEVKITTLAAYQAFVDHEVRESDLDQMKDNNSSKDFKKDIPVDPTTGRISPENIIEIIGRNPHHYPVDGGRLILLVPGSLGVNTNRRILVKDVINNINKRTSFSSRLNMIYGALHDIEFSFYATPKGDIVAEMPLYDFDPEDFGVDPIVAGGKDEIAATQLDALRKATGLPPISETGDTFGPFAPHYRVAKRDTIRWNRTFSDEKVRTQFRVSPNLAQSYGFGNWESVGLPPQARTLRALVPQFGVRVEVIPATSFMATEESAVVYGNIKLNQLNADARSTAIDVIPRLRTGPNRPMVFSERNYIATVRSTSKTLAWNSDFTMNLGVNYQRGWDGSVRDDDPKRLVYRPLGGTASRPMNYKVLFGLESTSETQKSGPSEEATDQDTSGQGLGSDAVQVLLDSEGDLLA